jgi:hypothetical protein
MSPNSRTRNVACLDINIFPFSGGQCRRPGTIVQRQTDSTAMTRQFPRSIGTVSTRLPTVNTTLRRHFSFNATQTP